MSLYTPTWQDLDEVKQEKRDASNARTQKWLDDDARFGEPTEAEVTAALNARGIYTRADVKADLIARGVRDFRPLEA